MPTTPIQCGARAPARENRIQYEQSLENATIRTTVERAALQGRVKRPKKDSRGPLADSQDDFPSTHHPVIAHFERNGLITTVTSDRRET